MRFFRSCFCPPSASSLKDAGVPPHAQHADQVDASPAAATQERAAEEIGCILQELVGSDFFSAESLWALARTHEQHGLPPIKFLRGSWLEERAAQMRSASTPEARQRLALPRRQDLTETNPAAFLTEQELIALPHREWEGKIHQLRLVIVSYCWHGEKHPDPDGEQLQRFVEVIARERSTENMSAQTPFPSGEYAVFVDWCSLTQKDASGHRSEAERAVFSYALERMQLLYAHALTTVAILCGLPLGWTRPSYEISGWPSFEFAVASLLKEKTAYSWAPVVFAEGAQLAYMPPLPPDAFTALLEQRHFTSGSDAAVVAQLYASTMNDALAAAGRIFFTDYGWSAAHVEALCEVLYLAEKVTYLSLRGNPCGSGGASALARALGRGCCPQLQTLVLQDTDLDDEGVRALAGVIERGSLASLKELLLAYNEGVSRAAWQALEGVCNARGIGVAGDF